VWAAWQLLRHGHPLDEVARLFEFDDQSRQLLAYDARRLARVNQGATRRTRRILNIESRDVPRWPSAAGSPCRGDAFGTLRRRRICAVETPRTSLSVPNGRDRGGRLTRHSSAHAELCE
jgi:hypothetical protein